jgi:mono/diheme cytochrome c family protein
MRSVKLNRTSLAVAAVVVALVAAGAWLRVRGGGEEPAPPAEGQTEAQKQAARGETLFAEKGCANCHDADASETGIGPGLKDVLDAETLPSSGRPATRENIRRQFNEPYDSMPSYEDRLSEEETEQLLAYMETL